MRNCIASVLLTSFSMLLLSILAGAARGATPAWYPVVVDVWDPPFNTLRQRSQQTYTPLEQASDSWNICVVIPHLKDAYWLAVNYGLIAEARRLGVGLSLYEAGGYEHLAVQREQIEQCLEDGFDGLIISAIAQHGFDDLLQRAVDDGVPVLDLINGMASTNISARVAVDFWDAGALAGGFIRQRHANDDAVVHVAWFPGPDGAAWVAAGDAGFRHAIADSSVEIIATRYGDTGRLTQSQLIEEVLAQDSVEVDYVVGTAVTADAASDVLRKHGLADRVEVLAYYYSPGVHNGLRRGNIVAAPSDQQALQARLAVDVMVRMLEKRDYLKHVAPRPVLIDSSSLRQWDSSTTLAPRGFRAIFSVNN